MSEKIVKKAKTYRFSQLTLQTLERLSQELETNKTMLIEIAVAQFDEMLRKRKND